MRKNYICLTNNPLMAEWGLVPDTRYLDVSIPALYKCVSQEIQKGRKLLSHPLSGSIRPSVTPYKSVLVSREKGTFDSFGFDIISKAMEYTDRLFAMGGTQKWNEPCKQDFQLIDATLIKYALERNQ